MVNNQINQTKIIKGTVIHGRKEGRKIGFPTANIKTKMDLSGFELGIYASKIKVKNQWYISATSYGTAPTYDFWEVTLETHILDFDMDIYDQTVELELVQYLRPIGKYEGLDKLITQIQTDCDNTRVIFKTEN
jgi:riboflavin kinase / FMN adenylyltransferase